MTEPKARKPRKPRKPRKKAILPDGASIPFAPILDADNSYVPTDEDFAKVPPFRTYKGNRIPTGPSTFSIVCVVCHHQNPLRFYTKLNTKSRKDYDCVCVRCRAAVRDVVNMEKLKKVRDARFTGQYEEGQTNAAKRMIKFSAAQEEKRQQRAAERSEAKEKAEDKALKRVGSRERVSAAELEFAQRTLIRRKLLPFIQKFQKNYQTGWVHIDICERLDKFVKAVENQESPRLMLFMPPRHGKSEIASKNLPAHILGNHPTWELISASYAVSLPMGFSKKIHATMADPYYQVLFPETKLHPKAQATDEWMTTQEGAYVAAGVGGGITGKGAHVLIIDDPVKDAQEADSQTQRDTVWDWWGSTAKTRLSPGGGVLIIQTRWHDDDLSGRLLMQMKDDTKELTELIDDAQQRMDDEKDVTTQAFEDAYYEKKTFEEELAAIDNWEVVQYPAVATFDEYVHDDGRITDTNDDLPGTRKVRDKGEPLHAARYPISRLMNMKRSMQKRHWSALYQQNPVPDEGMYFTKDMFRMVMYSPAVDQLKLFSAWDLAIGEKQSNDYTVGVVGGIDWMGQLNIVEIIRFRGDSHFIADSILNTYQKYPTIQQIGIEQGQLQMAIMPTLKELMKRKRLYPSLTDMLKPITDKQARARPLQGMMQQGRVIFPSSQMWFDDAKMELLRFPGGLHDDIVDALAWLAHMCVQVKPPEKPGTDNKKKSWKHKLSKYINGARQSGHMGA